MFIRRICWSIILAFFQLKVEAVKVAASDASVLITFKIGLTDQSDFFNGWSTTNDCSLWSGVTCNAGGRITTLQLDQTGVDGALPPSFGSLSFLSNLDLSQNNFEGLLPKEIGKLTNLEILNVNDNSFIGPIPTALGALTKLKSLNLGNNYFSGSIPLELANLKSLQQLALDFNLLAGSIPSQLGLLKALTTLKLAGNKLSGTIPKTLGSLTGLTVLDLSQNRLTGSIPAELRSLVKLTELDLNRNNFLGGIPSFIGNFTSLMYLDISNNKKLGGAIPGTFSTLTKLEYLYLTGSGLSGTIPSFLGSFAPLESLVLDANSFSGQIPSSLGNLKRLSILDLSSNSLTGEIPVRLGEVYNLEFLFLDGNGFEGGIPVGLTELEYLSHLDLSNNPKLYLPFPAILGSLYNLKYLAASFTNAEGNLPSYLNEYSELETLILDNNNLDGRIPASLTLLQKLSTLNLKNNYFTGGIPTSIGILKSLKTLDLSSNFLEGDFPATIGGLTSLEYLDLSDNEDLELQFSTAFSTLSNLQYLYIRACYLTGGLPNYFGNFKKLSILDLSSNYLVGSIPGAFGSMTNLIELHLGDNNLAGNIPTQLGSMSKLKTLDLSMNFLSGSIPVTIGSLTNLEYLDLQENNITNSIPSSVGSLTKLWHLDISSNKLNGTIPADLYKLKNLKQLDLQLNSITGSLASGISGLGTVQYLDLGFNKLGGSIPSEIGNLKTLLSLNLQSNNFASKLPPSLGNLPKLQTLFLQGNKLQGTVPVTLGNIKSLITLDLSSNLLTGTLPAVLGVLPSIQILKVASNYLTGFIPSTFKSPSLTALDVSNNYFTGSTLVTMNGNELPLSLDSSKGLFAAQNCLNYTCPVLLPCAQAQRPAAACESFCGALDPLGSCGGRGVCVPTGNGLGKCTCDVNHLAVTDGSLCIATSLRTTGTTFPAITTPKYLLQSFRHSSAAHIFSATGISKWTVVFSWNWAEELTNWAVRDQGSCFGCWAYATVGAVEAAVAIATNTRTPPQLSENQILSCFAQGSCDGGWPGDALEYVSVRNLLPASLFKGSCPSASVTSGYRVSYYEQVNFIGYFGLLLAVQQQPVIATVDGSSPDFVQYKSGIFYSPTCYNDGVDHSLLIVGYDLTGPTPYWVLRNSWGSSWGEKGYMRMAITGGPGTCGINVLPAYFPVLAPIASDSCNTRSFGSFLGNSLGQPGTLNPCGRFPCSKLSSGKQVCACKAPYLAVNSKDGKYQTCTLASPCSYFPTNPCGVGTCVNSAKGTYTCLCPIGYGLTQFTLDKSPTCGPAPIVPGPQYYNVPAGVFLDCTVIARIYGMSVDDFKQQNLNVDCTLPSLPSGTVLNVTSDQSCSLPYLVQNGDTCASIASLFEIPSLNGADSPNPDLNCDNLASGIQVCIVKGEAPDIPVCTFPLSLQTSPDGAPVEKCSDIISSYFGGDAKTFFTLNPGIYCNRLSSPLDFKFAPPLLSVCLEATSLRSIFKRCRSGKFAVARAGDTCRKIYATYFSNTALLYKKANQGTVCRDKRLFAGLKFCTKYK